MNVAEVKSPVSLRVNGALLLSPTFFSLYRVSVRRLNSKERGLRCCLLLSDDPHLQTRVDEFLHVNVQPMSCRQGCQLEY
jgi:hypothetical protein